MINRLRPRITYANVVSSLCLFILLGGGAYAATQLAPGSVGTKQLKDNAVISKKVKDHALTAKDVKAGQFVPAAKLPGLVRGPGRLISAGFIGTTRARSPFVTAPGGLAITLACNSSGYEISGSSAQIGNNAFDQFVTVFGSGPPSTSYSRVDKNTFFTHSSQTTTSRRDYDISSLAGRASFTIWAAFNASNQCIVKARGVSNP
jgi:hypothetical protein